MSRWICNMESIHKEAWLYFQFFIFLPPLFFSSPCGTFMMHILMCLMVPLGFLILFIFLYPSFFLLLRLGILIALFSLIFFSCMIKPLLNPSRKFFISVIVIFSYIIFIWFLFIISISLLMFPTYSYSILLISFLLFFFFHGFLQLLELKKIKVFV